MNTDNQNKFYTSISEHYSEIFPFNPKQLEFIDSFGNLAGKHILDIGCATGTLAYQLAGKGAKVTGIDLNEDLLKKATGSAGSSVRKQELAFPVPTFHTGDMLELANDFEPESFDIVLCFGNTLVHLHEAAQVSKMFKGVSHVLKPHGKFLIQILNYDYILQERIEKLPVIETENIRFSRKYRFEANNPLIQFETELYLKKEDKSVVNETSLLALQSDELRQLLENAGFGDVSFYSGFDHGRFGGNHIPFVVSCKKF